MATFQNPQTQDSPGKDNENVQEAFWSIYKQETKEYDKEIVDDSIGDADIVLIFAGLFSAVNTAFIIESYKLLSPDPTMETNVILSQILFHLNNSFTPDPFPPAAISAHSSAVPINALLFTSLCFSLFTAFGAVLGKQWLYQYGRSEPASSNVEHGRKRQLRYSGIELWHLLPLIESLPTLLQISLILFQAALILFLWTLNIIIASIILVLTVIPIAVYIIVIFRSAIYPDSPYQSPVTRFLKNILQIISSTASEFDLLDWNAVERILLKSNSLDSIVAAARFIPTCSAPAAVDTVLDRLCQILSNVSAEHRHPVERAVVHIVLMTNSLSETMHDNLFKICNKGDLPDSEELWNETHLFIASLRFILTGRHQQFLTFSNQYLSVKSTIPRWYLHVVTRANSVDPSWSSRYWVGTFVRTAFNLRPLPPLGDIVQFYMPLAFGFSPRENLVYTYRDLVEGFTYCFYAISKMLERYPPWLPTETAESVLMASIYCTRNNDFMSAFEENEGAISSLFAMVPGNSTPNDLTPLMAQVLYRHALRQPWKFWMRITRSGYGADFFRNIDPSAIPTLIERCKAFGDESLIVFLILLGSISRESGWQTALSVVPEILLGVIDQLNLGDKAIGNLAFLLIASLGHLCFPREDPNVEVNSQLDNHISKLHRHIRHHLLSTSASFPPLDSFFARTLLRFAVTGVVPADIAPLEDGSFNDELLHISCYNMIILDLCHNSHFIDIILLDEECHLQNLLSLANSLLDIKALDALTCLWSRCRADKRGYFLSTNIISEFCKLLLKLCRLDIQDDVTFRNGLRSYAEIYTCASNDVVYDLKQRHDRLLQDAHLTPEEFIALVDMDSQFVCADRDRAQEGCGVASFV